MQRRGVKVGAVRPHERVDLRIDPHLPEKPRITQWPVEFPGQNRLEVDDVLAAIIKSNTKRVIAHDLD